MKLSKKTKQTMAKLTDKEFVWNVFQERLFKYYPDGKKIIALKITPYKKHLGKTSAVFVLEYKIAYLNSGGQKKSLTVFASAHSDNSRKIAYQRTKVLYKNGFDQGSLRVTRPLFFLSSQRAFFYQASAGSSLFSFFTKNPEADFEPSIKLAADWIKKLHDLSLDKNKLKWNDFQIKNMLPTPSKFIKDFYLSSRSEGRLIEKLFKDMSVLERKINHRLKKQVIYGDYHPENIIVANLRSRTLEMIDFTDIAFGDPMLDLGVFLQQFDFMGHNFLSRKKINIYKEYFLENYFEIDFKKIESGFFSRINLYQSWTALRSAVFIFYMRDNQDSIRDLLIDSRAYLNLSKSGEKKISLY
ncbi:MAG: phosphotransferase [Patescibacteria group bacterium]|nr:phosphotransferase [Patescibacteria group bacterium]